MPLYKKTVRTIAKSGSTQLQGDVTLSQGTNITLTQSGNDISIAASGGAGSGDVVGPASATDNAIVRFDSTTGKLVQDSVVTVADTTGDIAGAGSVSLRSAGFVGDANANELIKFPATVASAVNEITVSNAATGNPPIIEATGGDSNSHLVVRAKGNGLTKISVLEQLNTTDGYKHNNVFLSGWGIFAAGAVANKSETVTFGITFAARPIVVLCYGGDSAAANTSYGSGANTVKGPVCAKAHTIATGSFVAHIHTSDGTSWGATDNTFYQWIATGQL